MIIDSPRLIMVAVTVTCTLTAVFIHYEGLRMFRRFMELPLQPLRKHILALLCGVLALHMIEIWVFAVAYYWVVQFPQLGVIAGSPSPMIMEDFAYFSASAFSTVGFGDLYPVGHIRLLAGTEGVTGLMLIAWSASYIFIEKRPNS